jgi:hypothetical protein
LLGINNESGEEIVDVEYDLVYRKREKHRYILLIGDTR